MAPAQKITSDRVTRVKIEPYDQVFALTQKLVNDGLKTNFTILTAKKESPLNIPFGCYQRAIGNIKDAKLDYPRVIVETGLEENLSGVFFAMCFSSGSMKVEYDILDSAGNPKGAADLVTDLTGWKIAFRLQLGMTLIERTSDKFKSLMGDSPKAGQYSLNELSAKFETAEFNRKCFELSDFGTFDWSTVPKEAVENFMILVTKQKDKFLGAINEAKTIGYALKSPDQQQKPHLTFEPFAIQYQTYPWIDPGAIEPKPLRGLTGNARLNYLLYCETTDKKPLPPIDQRMLARTGNWTDGVLSKDANSETSDFGSFHMTHRNFFNGYLLKQLRVLNRVLEPTISFVKAKVDDWRKPWTDYNADLLIGNTRGRSPDDPYYDFKKKSDTLWEFESSSKPTEDSDKAGHEGWSAKCWSNAECYCKNSISFEPGTDIIIVKGWSCIRLTFKYWEYKVIGDNIDRFEDLKWTIDWSLQLDLEAVKDGGLQIVSEFQKPIVNMLAESAVTLKKYSKYTEDAIQTGLNNMDDLRKKLAEDLEGKQGLCLPAGGVFFFKNPVLSHKGDLVVSLQYNDTVTPSKMLDPNDKTVINENGSDRAQIAGGNRSEMPPPPGPQKVKIGA